MSDAATDSSKAKPKNKLVKPVAPGYLTRVYEKGRQQVYAWAGQVRSLFFGNSWAAGLLWGLCVLSCVAVLVWFFLFSVFGTPAAPVYEAF